MRAALRELLASFRAVDALEAGHARRMRELIDQPEPFARHTFEPGHFTASAFVLAPAPSPRRAACGAADPAHAVRDERELLLILHGKLGRWLQPGGHIDPDDAGPVEAARREVAEETGLTDLRLASPGLFDVDVHTIPPLRGQPAHEHFDLRFLFVAPTRELAAGSDAKAARWVPLSEVERIESDESVMRAVRRLLRRA